MTQKIWRWIKIFLLALGICLIIFSDIQGQKKRLRILPTQAELDSVLPGALLKDRKEKPIPHYPGKVIVQGKPKKAVALLSAEIPPKIQGFTDQINILFSMDQDGNILKLRVISHKETPYYFRLIRGSGFLDRLIGKNFNELSEIKAVSGATISSKAILEDLKTSGQIALKEIFQKDTGQGASVSLAKVYLQPKIALLLAILLMGIIARYVRSLWFRWMVLALSVMVIGFWLKTPFALPHLFQIASLQLPFSSNPYLILLGGFIILSTLFFGPLWCTYLCPYAALQELMSRMGKNYHWHPSGNFVRTASELRWLVLFSSVLLYFGLKIGSAAEIEPFFHLFSAKWTLAGMTLVLLTLVASFFVPRFWCRFFCPTGACLILFSSHRRIFRRIEQGIKASEIEVSEEQEPGRA